MTEKKEQESFYPKCHVCKKTIKADEGRFSCESCHRYEVCEECGKRLEWDRGKPQRCFADGSYGMMWFEGKKGGLKP